MFENSQGPPVCMQPLVELVRALGKLSVTWQIGECTSRPILHRPVTWLANRDRHTNRNRQRKDLVRQGDEALPETLRGDGCIVERRVPKVIADDIGKNSAEHVVQGEMSKNSVVDPVRLNDL